MVAKVIVVLKIIVTKDYGFTLEPKNGDLQTMAKKRDLNEMLKLGSQDFFWREKRVKDM